MLISLMVLCDLGKVSASEQLYYYDRYRIEYDFSVEILTERMVIGNTWVKNPLPNKAYYYPAYTRTETGFSLIGTPIVREIGDSPVVGYYVNGSSNYVHKILPDTIYDGSHYIDQIKGLELRGRFNDTVTGTLKQYSDNGVHGNYWYIRRGLANTDPTVTLSSPGENSYFV